MSFEAIAHVIREKKRFVLCAHYNPDGDAVGSVDALEALGKEFDADSYPSKKESLNLPKQHKVYYNSI